MMHAFGMSISFLWVLVPLLLIAFGVPLVARLVRGKALLYKVKHDSRGTLAWWWIDITENVQDFSEAFLLRGARFG